jgi:hypothetical protein
VFFDFSLQQKIVLKLPLDDERKRRKAFKAAVGMNGKTNLQQSLRFDWHHHHQVPGSDNCYFLGCRTIPQV